MGYKYDIFVSYRRSPTAGQWVRKHLVPRLKSRIDEVSPEPIELSCDDQIESGANWPAELRYRLRHSRLLLAVWSADFFRSPWCMAEWMSFKHREQLVGSFSPAEPRGLVCPIRYTDGDHYHPDARLSQCVLDFSKLNSPDESFQKSATYVEFDSAVQELAAELVKLLNRTPDWRDDFPIAEPPPLPAADLKRPRV